MTTEKTCPVHGWTLIQKFRFQRLSNGNELAHPIDEWWCRSCGYDSPVPASLSPKAVPPGDPAAPASGDEREYWERNRHLSDLESLDRTTDSGKSLWRCRRCGRETPLPDRECYTFRMAASGVGQEPIRAVLDALKAVVYSAHPSKAENPAMFEAWQLAHAVIAKTEALLREAR